MLLGDFVLGIDLSFEVAPAVNRTISRIYRDTRFSKDKSEPIRTWYNHKSFYLSCNRKNDKAIRSGQLVDDLIAGFGATAPLYHYLLDTIARTKQPTQDKSPFLRRRRHASPSVFTTLFAFYEAAWEEGKRAAPGAASRARADRPQ